MFVAVVLVGALACGGCSAGGTGADLGLEKLEAGSAVKLATVPGAAGDALTVPVAKSEAAPVSVAKTSGSSSSTGSSSSKSSAGSTADSPFRRDMSAFIKTPSAP